MDSLAKQEWGVWGDFETFQVGGKERQDSRICLKGESRFTKQPSSSEKARNQRKEIARKKRV